MWLYRSRKHTIFIICTSSWHVCMMLNYSATEHIITIIHNLNIKTMLHYDILICAFYFGILFRIVFYTHMYRSLLNILYMYVNMYLLPVGTNKCSKTQLCTCMEWTDCFHRNVSTTVPENQGTTLWQWPS